MNGVTVIRGIEFDITAPRAASTSFPTRVSSPLSLRSPPSMNACSPPADRSIHTAALESILYNPYVNAFGHLGNPTSRSTMNTSSAAATSAARSSRSTTHLCPSVSASHDNCMDIARMCMKYEVPIVGGQRQPHLLPRRPCRGRARHARGDRLSPEELIINSSMARLVTLTSRARGMHLFAAKEDLL